MLTCLLYKYAQLAASRHSLGPLGQPRFPLNQLLNRKSGGVAARSRVRIVRIVRIVRFKFVSCRDCLVDLGSLLVTLPYAPLYIPMLSYG